MELQILPDQLIHRPARRSGTCEFFSEYEKTQFDLNCDNPRMSDKYKDGTLQYTFNSLGYRTGQLNRFNDNEFILVFGCSYTEGVGLHEYDIWHSHLSRKFARPIMNLAIGGTGGDVIRLNSVLYNKNNFPKPKLVIFQWPGDHRRMFASEDVFHIDPNTPPAGLDGEFVSDKYFIPKYRRADIEWYQNRYVAYSEEAQQTVFQNYITANTVFNLNGVPTYNWQYSADRAENTDNPLLEGYQLKQVDVTGSTPPMARDLMHPGEIPQKETYEQIYQEIGELL